MTGVAGLRRFANAPVGRAGSPDAAGRRPADPIERCEMCGEPVADRHGHVVDIEKRALVCTCRPCYLLFTRDGAAGGRYRAIPDRVRHDPAHPLRRDDWEALQIPVGTAFFFHNSTLGRVVAGYPSPAGVTECELDLAEWQRLATAYPLLAAIAPDVEAVYVTRTGDRVAAYTVPIDACYALVGEVRMRWSGLDGGAEVRQTLSAFLADLQHRAEPLRPLLRPDPAGGG